MRRSIFALVGATALVAGAAFYAQTHAEDSALGNSTKGVAVGSLTCSAADGAAFVFGSTRHLDCLFARIDGSAELYRGSIKRFGADSGFSNKSHVVWLVIASGSVEPGALAGDYGIGVPVRDNNADSDPDMLVDTGNRRISLEPVHVHGEAGLNVAAGVAEVTLQSGT
jgi:hypothetical protein